MIDEVYEIIDEINNSDFKKRLDNIKLKINSDMVAKDLIKKFEEAKENYERYNLKEDFIKAKKELFKNELIREYIELQNKINILSIKINNRIKQITK